MNDLYLQKPRKKKKRKIAGLVIEEESSDHPLHEEYAHEGSVKH